MGLNVSSFTGYQFENQENLKQTAKLILSKKHSTQSTEKAIQKIFSSTDNQIKELYTNQQLAILKASAQISMNDSLKETLKYLRKYSKKEKISKKHLLGEIWELVTESNEDLESNPYNGELVDYVIDQTTKNIFAA